MGRRSMRARQEETTRRAHSSPMRRNLQPSPFAPPLSVQLWLKRTHDASRAAGERCSRGLTMPALRQLTCLLAGSASLLSLMPGLSATAASQSAASTSLARLCFVASASARKWCADRHQRGQASRRVAKSVGDPSRQPTSLSRHRAVNPRSSRRVNPGNPA